MRLKAREVRRFGPSLWPIDSTRPIPSRNGVGRLGHVSDGPQAQSHDPDCGGDQNSEDNEARRYDRQAQALGRRVDLSKGRRNYEFAMLARR